MIVFGPVPSRRLGQSIGINNIPPKICTYSCVYCQLGRTTNMKIKRQKFYKPEKILQSVKEKIQATKEKNESIDYLTFVSDGEPTLDVNLGEEIKLLNQLGIKIAVITNSSLIWKKDVRDDLSNTDWVSLKIDTISQEIWHKLNRAHRYLKLEEILDGIKEFSNCYKNYLTTETMLVNNLNTRYKELEKIADFIRELKTKKSYISIPIRPPAEKWAKRPTEQGINEAFQIFKDKGINVEYLIGYEGNEFAFTGDVEKDILSITSVHPMRQDAVNNFLLKAKSNWKVIEELLEKDKLVEIEYSNNKFYIRKLQ